MEAAFTHSSTLEKDFLLLHEKPYETKLACDAANNNARMAAICIK
jgi:hypothetical protein